MHLRKHNSDYEVGTKFHICISEDDRKRIHYLVERLRAVLSDPLPYVS